MTQTIVTTSGKGGVGKTNISVNTAIELARRNYRTCLFDADLGLANVNILLGINPENSLDDYIFGDKELNDVVLRTKFDIDIIPGSSGIEKMANLDREEVAGLIDSLSQIRAYDYFLIDTSSGISRGVIAFCLAGNETIIVITAEATSLTDAYALLKVMASNNYAGTVKILVNKSPSIPQAKATYLRFKEVVKRHLNIHIAPAGIILNDPNIEKAMTMQEPVLIRYPNSLASQCFKVLVENITQKDSKIEQGDDFCQFWQRYFDYALPDLSKAREPQKSGENSSLPSSSLPPDMPPNVSSLAATLDQPREQTRSTADTPKKPIFPFNRVDGLIDPAQLVGPTPLLSKALDLLTIGKLNKRELLNIISSDPVLMVKALKMRCTPGRNVGRTKRLTSRQQLLEDPGVAILTNLLSTTVMQRAFLHRPPPGTTEIIDNFWFHSYQCAVLAEGIAEISDYPFPEEAFIAGLIHDIGRLALQTDHPEVYAQFPLAFRHDKTLLQTEQRIFGKTHGEIAAESLRAWNLDSFLADAVQYHTEPLANVATAFNLVKIVFLACQLTGSTKDEPESCKKGEALLGIPHNQLKKLADSAYEKVQLLADRFKISPVGRQDNNKVDEIETHFRQQVADYSILQGILPGKASARELLEIIRPVIEAFDILFNYQATICLLPDDRFATLTAIEYPGCFGEDTLSGMHFSLHWEKSMVVKSFATGELQIAMDGESSGVLPLSDRQLLRSLGTEGFVCVPMVFRGNSMGIIVLGIQKSQVGKIRSAEQRLLQLGVQGAGNIYSMENSSGNQGDSSHSI